MISTSSHATPTLLQSGLPRAELITSIATLYLQSMHAKCAGQPADVREYHIGFAEKVLNKDFYGLEHICNGLNSVGKEVFCTVAGLKLPKAQGASREALRAWCGVSELDDDLTKAKARLDHELKSAQRVFKENMPAIITMIEGWYSAGYVLLMSQNKRNYIANRAQTQGRDLSTRGLHGSKFRPYLEAYLSLQALRVQKGEITEPEYQPPTAVSVVAPVSEPKPTNEPAHSAPESSAPMQHGFCF